MKKIISKLTSRKLWASIAGIVAGLAMVFGLDDNTIGTVSGAVVSAASIVAYIIGEARVDAAAVMQTASSENRAVTYEDTV